MLEFGVLAEGVGELHGLAVVGGVVDVYGDGAADDVAVVAPDEHFLAADFEAVLAIEGVEVPAGLIGFYGGVGKVVAAVGLFDDDLAMGLEVVGGEEEVLPGGEEDAAVFEDDAEGDVLRLREFGGVGPGGAVVFGEHDAGAFEGEGFAVALGIDVRGIG